MCWTCPLSVGQLDVPGAYNWYSSGYYYFNETKPGTLIKPIIHAKTWNETDVTHGDACLFLARNCVQSSVTCVVHLLQDFPTKSDTHRI